MTPTPGALEVICRNAELEARLIDDLLDVTRIARGKVELDRRSVDLCIVLNTPWRSAGRTSRPGSCIRRRHRRRAAPGDADAARLQQVFWNLLKNAIKFTPHGGCIERPLPPRRRGLTSMVEVNDSGMGIDAAGPAADLQRLRAGRARHHAAVRRPGAGAGHQQGHGRDARRDHRGPAAPARARGRPSPSDCPLRRATAWRLDRVTRHRRLSHRHRGRAARAACASSWSRTMATPPASCAGTRRQRPRSGDRRRCGHRPWNWPAARPSTCCSAIWACPMAAAWI